MTFADDRTPKSDYINKDDDLQQQASPLPPGNASTTASTTAYERPFFHKPNPAGIPHSFSDGGVRNVVGRSGVGGIYAFCLAPPKHRVSPTMLSRAAFTVPSSQNISWPCELSQEAAAQY